VLCPAAAANLPASCSIPWEADIFLGVFPLVHHVENFINETVQANEALIRPALLAPA